MPTLCPEASWSVLERRIVTSSPVVAEAQVLDVEPDELGAPAAAREAEAEQGAVPDVAWIVSSHRIDEGAQGVDEHRVLLVRGDADRAALHRRPGRRPRNCGKAGQSRFDPRWSRCLSSFGFGWTFMMSVRVLGHTGAPTWAEVSVHGVS